jgi:hypothetical protein
MNIGNIVSKTKIEIENFKICESLECINEELPTLIIGRKLSKELLGEGISIIHKKVSNKLFWTFDKTERKSEYESDIEQFKEYCFESFGSNIPYVYLDILYNSRKINYRIIKKILSLKSPIVYFSENDMVYIYSENIIFGVDLNVLNYFQGKKEKIVERIKRLNGNTLIDYTIFNKCRDLIYKLKNKNRFVPYIYGNGNGIER